MAFSVATTQSQDAATKRPSAIGSQGGQVTTEATEIFSDGFEGATVDTARWTVTTGGTTGVVTQASGQITIDTGTNAAGTASILSVPILAVPSGGDVSARASLRFSAVPITGNTRQFSLRVDTNNYFGFFLDGTAWVARAWVNGAVYSADIPITFAPLPDTLAFIELEIRASKDRVHFMVNDQEAAVFSTRGQVAQLWRSSLAQAYFLAVNSGAVVSSPIVVEKFSATRWHTTGANRIAHFFSTSDSLIVRGPCELVGVFYLDATTQSVDIRDAVAAAGGTIAFTVRGQGSLFPFYVPLNLRCSNGLYFDHNSGTAMNISVLYRLL